MTMFQGQPGAADRRHPVFRINERLDRISPFKLQVPLPCDDLSLRKAPMGRVSRLAKACLIAPLFQAQRSGNPCIASRVRSDRTPQSTRIALLKVCVKKAIRPASNRQRDAKTSNARI